MFHDTKFMLLWSAMMLPGISRRSERERTPEEEERKKAQEAAYDEWRRTGGSFSGLGVRHSCRGGCPYCGGWR